MSHDVPPDVTAVLRQLFSAGQQATENGDIETALRALDAAERVISNKVPDEQERKRLLHGCQRATEHLGPDGAGDGAVAAEYLAAMERQLGEE